MNSSGTMKVGIRLSGNWPITRVLTSPANRPSRSWKGSATHPGVVARGNDS